MAFEYDEKYDEYEYDEPCDEYEYSKEDQAKYEVETAVYNAIVYCLQAKCNSKESINVQYISPQELLSYLPKSLAIDRDLHIIKHGSGQWEVSNNNIHSYFGFQVQTDDPYTISVIKDLIRMNSQQYRDENGIIDDEKEAGDCAVCGGAEKIDPRFGVHICRVSGYFKCFNYICKGRTFKVGICLLDPHTCANCGNKIQMCKCANRFIIPPTRYKCANCGNPARFIRYDLKQKKKEKEKENEQTDPNAQHRKDLCEACDIWTDCRLTFVQPSAVFDALLNAYCIRSNWKMNDDGTVTCSFPWYDYDQSDLVFDIKPYVYCHYVNTKQFYYVQNNFSPNQNNFSPNQNNLRNRNKKQQKQRRPAANVKSRNNKLSFYK